MATKKKIAEQILRIVQGGNVSDDSSIDIREVMALIDQERDSIIKREIMNRVYAKSTTTNSSELEITGDWLSTENLTIVNNSYGTLSSMPINLPNDLGMYRVEALAKNYTKQKTSITLYIGVSAPNSVKEMTTMLFSVGPRVLDPIYNISITFNDGSIDHKIKLKVNTKNFDTHLYNTLNLVEAIKSSSDYKDFLKRFSLNNNLVVPFDGWGSLSFQGLYTFTVSDFKVNGKESGNSSHGFTYTTNESNTFSQTNISDSQLEVQINSDIYTLDYTDEDYGAVSVTQIARNFVDEFSYEIAMKNNVSVTCDPGSDTITFEEMEDSGGFTISSATPGDLAASITEVPQVDPSMFSKFKKRRILTRIPSGGEHNNMYHNLATKSGREFYYMEGNRIYLYKNTQQALVLKVHFIATSRGIADDEHYPVPADYEKEIIVNTVNLFGLMKKAREDLVNDNIG